MFWAERFCLKSAICLVLAERAQVPQSRVMFTSLAANYARMAVKEGFERSTSAALLDPLAKPEEAAVK